jgi:hypothetical protein
LIARLQISLPTDTIVLSGENLAGLETSVEVARHGQVRAVVHPPYASRRQTGRVVMLGDGNALNPLDPQPVDETTEIDGKAVVRCDAIAVDLISETDFDRSIGAAAVPLLLSAACDALNGVLERIRVLVRVTHLKPLRPETAEYRLVFLDDDGAVVDSEPGKFRETANVMLRIRHMAITPAAWLGVADLGPYEIQPWDQLLLDAQDFDTELGPTVVLAMAAVETRIATALDLLAPKKLSTGLWEWLRERDDDYRKTPSVSEQLDVLLGELGARSLKDDGRLWQAFQQLRAARNSFVHEGRAMIGRNRTEPVTDQKAKELALVAGEIIDFIEQQLPEPERRPRFDVLPSVTTTTEVPIVGDSQGLYGIDSLQATDDH